MVVAGKPGADLPRADGKASYGMRVWRQGTSSGLHHRHRRRTYQIRSPCLGTPRLCRSSGNPRGSLHPDPRGYPALHRRNQEGWPSVPERSSSECRVVNHQPEPKGTEGGCFRDIEDAPEVLLGRFGTNLGTFSGILSTIRPGGLHVRQAHDRKQFATRRDMP